MQKKIYAYSLAVALFIGFSLVFLLIRGAYPTPFSDEFYFYRLYFSAGQGNIDIEEIFQPHFGHIYILLKSWFWLIVHYGIDWRVSMYAQVAFIIISIAFMCCYSFMRIYSNTRFFVAIAVALALGSARQNENLYWALQVSAATMLLFTITAFYSASKFLETKKNIYALFAFIFSCVALLSNGGGLVSFFITIVAIIIGIKGNYLRLIAAAMAIVCFLGIFNYMSTSTGGAVAPSLINIVNCFTYVLAFFSNAIFSFSERGDDICSLSLGSIILLITAFAMKSTWFNKSKLFFPYLLIAFSFVSCLLIAYARLDGGIWQPNASRYYPFAAMILVGNLLVLGQSKRKSHKYLVFVIFISIVLSFAKSYFTEWKMSAHRYINSKNAHFSLCGDSSNGLAFRGDLMHTNIKVLQEVFCNNNDIMQAHIKSQPILIEIGPTHTIHGILFNPQPNGESAIWAKTENCESFCSLVFSGVELAVVANEAGTILTATIPKELYQSQGEKIVYVKNSRSGKKSRSILFQVL